ncbi:hypothetical protein [Thermobispora bispora]|uniref:Uncharacterized protein n=1 Tax=Thermobispora bispora (strain ATCC 19993 / DSM 43833 / CBS 139.67 / JCM 10125 / KCTC 9307 / NBRC 14880 / R51) TaxID=469371 RepID=D6Y239_THEBD|nr:hypothetical protein [Thermobispora bispora]ADG86774.1 hypothetical protein Tbis_0037 [Thermobispora bispora DSM 43833]MBX6167945.1 hypothetical protein [Thermobispora bispora]MDI9580782.1 hypothetical protein [Thermobispora sp.]
MARIALTVLGIFLALWLVFGFVLPTLFAIFKFLLFAAVLAFLGFVAVTLVGKVSGRS